MNTFPFGICLSSSWVMLVLEFVFIGLVLALILGFLRIVFRPARGEDGKDEPGTDDPLQILQLRLAKGEITKDEYKELKQVLQDE